MHTIKLLPKESPVVRCEASSLDRVWSRQVWQLVRIFAPSLRREHSSQDSQDGEPATAAGEDQVRSSVLKIKGNPSGRGWPPRQTWTAQNLPLFLTSRTHWPGKSLLPPMSELYVRPSSGFGRGLSSQLWEAYHARPRDPPIHLSSTCVGILWG